MWDLVVEASKVITAFNLHQPTRVALILETNWNYSAAYVYDPFKLLPAHHVALRPYFDNLAWRDPRFPKPNLPNSTHYNDMHGQLPISAHWFIEEPFAQINKKLTEAWAGEFSETLYGHLPINNNRQIPSTRNLAMTQIAPQAVQMCLSRSVSDMSQKVSKGFVDLMVGISAAKEEGESVRGRLVLLPVKEPLDVVLKVSRMPTIKQCVKLLNAVRNSNYALVIDASGISGFSLHSGIQGNQLSAEFGELGCTLCSNGTAIANIRANYLVRSEGQPYLKILNSELSAKFGSQLSAIEKIVEHIVESARTGNFGCTIGIFEPTENSLIGAYFDNPKKYVDIEPLLKGMAHVDGAIHINTSGEMLGFGVLLDGLSVPKMEIPDKGARHNSAIRFTVQNQNSIIVVVSEDGPITIFSNGKAARQQLILTNPNVMGPVPAVEDWFAVQA